MMRHRLPMLVALVVASTAGCAQDEGAGDDVVIETQDEPYDSSGISAWGEAYEKRESGKGDTPGCSGVLVPDTSGFGGRIALTFDDGPEPRPTNMVLDVLQAHDVKAAFFINGKRVDSSADQEALRRIVDEGHILANHSQNHTNLGTQSELATVEAEVDATHSIIEEAGVDPVYFRFPFGSSTCATADLVESFGYRITGWHNDSADWCFASRTGGVGHCAESTFKHVDDDFRDDMVGLVMSQARARNGGILLFHDVHMNTAETLDEIISRLQDEGFTFVNIDDVGTFPLLNNDDLDSLPWTGTTCVENTECAGFMAGSCLTYDAPDGTAGFCTTACEGFCDDFPGRAGTFCTSPDGGASGTCMSKPGDANNDCADLPGTSIQQRSRFIGDSGAPATTAAVCFPDSLL